MSENVPLGRREDLRLEFKSAEALERPEIIGREVAAMLNAEGGEVWVGLRDEEGRAVEVQAVPNAEQAAESLLDSLIDRIEPSPLPQEIEVRAVPVDDGISILRVAVKPHDDRRPYALLKSGGRHFQVRVGARLRPMSRQEIQDLFGSASKAEAEESGRLDAAIQEVLEDRIEFQRTAREVMWLRLRPVPAIDIDIQSPLFEELLRDPARSGNRPSGWHFATSSEDPRISRGKVSWSYREWDIFRAEVRADGGMLFLVPIASLHWKGGKRELWPEALLEFPISGFRLAREIYRDTLEKSARIVADLAFFGIRGWKLRPGSPRMGGWRMRPAVEFGPDEDLTWELPLVFEYRNILETPDRCGFRLVRRVYEAFGFREGKMPCEYDDKSGRLILPE